MSKLKNTKKLSIMKVVGIVFLVACLVTAVVMTSDTTRKFLINSFAGEPCEWISSPSARRTCIADREAEEEAEKRRLREGGRDLTNRQQDLLDQNENNNTPRPVVPNDNYDDVESIRNRNTPKPVYGPPTANATYGTPKPARTPVPPGYWTKVMKEALCKAGSIPKYFCI